MNDRLLVDIIEETVDELREKADKLHELNAKFRQTYDRDIRHEMDDLIKEMRRIRSSLSDQLYIHMDELRNIKKYYPELLEIYADDPFIGKTIQSKMWLLEFEDLGQGMAAKKLDEIRQKRHELRGAREELSRRGRLRIKETFLEQFPILSEDLEEGMLREEALDIIEEKDRKLKRDGWLVLITTSLIGRVAMVMLQKVAMAAAAERQAEMMVKEAHGQGTIAEDNARRKLNSAIKKRKVMERKIAHLLQANPDYLKSLKKSTLAKGPDSALRSFAKNVPQKSIKEKPWLDAMRKKLS
jgi:hypothetical protein